ncbi:hypothetical protein [Actinoplanes sp. M2I2]|uniref:hypothetical protein n=1 Tax=Actinoplanes sp. M2I2 TaxID=1734444 RepID=UPI002021A2A3|nr:hypothetical protein [Actinoplanes sp. M2I2]
MRSDDLVPLLGKQPSSGAPFRQGVIVSWNPDTAANVVLVAGSLMENLPILNTSEASLLKAGDVVGIITSGATWAILGRFVYPGTPEAVSSIQSITNRIKVANDYTSGTRNSTTWGDLTGTDPGPEVTIRVGGSGRALVFWGAELGQTANWQTQNSPHVGVEVSGATSIVPYEGWALNYHLEFPVTGAPAHAEASSWFQMSTFHTFTGLNPGDTTFTLKYKHDTLDPAGTVSFNNRELAVFAL